MDGGERAGWDVPDYWLPRPLAPSAHGPPSPASLEAFTGEHVLGGDAGEVPRPLPCPAWTYLTWLGEAKGLMLHGSGHPSIETFTPRAPNDRSPDAFSKQRAVYATTDGIWAIFYAVLARGGASFSFVNAAVQFGDGDGGWSPMHYYFSLSRGAPDRPWRPGTVYILPRDGFEQQPPDRIGDRPVVEPHFACPAPVRPLAKLPVLPEDFPFLDRVARHDRERVDARSAEDPYGFPWLDP